MTKDKERDDALIAEARKNIEKICPALKEDVKTIAAEVLRLERLRGDEPAKPDRYAVIAEEITSAANIVSHGGYYELDIEAADAVLRKHFEPPREVVEAARAVRKWYSGLSNPRLLADFILKGDV